MIPKIALPIIGQFLIELLDWWLRKNKRDEKMLKSYYKFLDHLDKRGLARVAHLKSAEDARAQLAEEIKRGRQ